MKVRYSFSSRFARKERKPSNTNKHRVPFPKLARDVIKQSDIVLEILDARFIDKTRNRELEKEVSKNGKKLIFVLNKADLISVSELKRTYDLASLSPYVLFSTKTQLGHARLRNLIKIEAKRSKFKRGQVGIIGYPNTGKSSLINVLAGGSRASTSSQAGHTKGIQKIRFSSDIILLDTPGVIDEHDVTSATTAANRKYAEINVERYDKVPHPDLVVQRLMEETPKIFDEFYGVNSDGDVEILLETLGKKWKLLKKGGEIDLDRTARRIVKDWQEGKIKRDRPQI